MVIFWNYLRSRFRLVTFDSSPPVICEKHLTNLFSLEREVVLFFLKNTVASVRAVDAVIDDIGSGGTGNTGHNADAIFTPAKAYHYSEKVPDPFSDPIQRRHQE